MSRRVQILAVGKLRDPRLRAVCDDYYERCSRLLKIEERELRDLPALAAAVTAEDTLVLLDERGELLDSRAFAARLRGWTAGRSRLLFAVGGADGLGDELRERADAAIAFGRMTVAHRLARALLAEQLYRAVTILDGHPYHR